MKFKYNPGSYNFGRQEKRFHSRILRLIDYLKGVTIARQQINYLKPLFINKVEGKIIEIGGYDDFFKRNYIKGEYSNLDIVSGPHIDIIADAGDMHEIKDESIDSFICISVLEHTLYPEKIIQVISKKLKKNGTAYISIPWIFEGHMEPQDYFRFSRYYMETIFSKHGFEIEYFKNCNSLHGAIAHLLQKNLFFMWAFGILFMILELFSKPCERYSTQYCYFLRKTS